MLEGTLIEDVDVVPIEIKIWPEADDPVIFTRTR